MKIHLEQKLAGLGSLHLLIRRYKALHPLYNCFAKTLLRLLNIRALMKMGLLSQSGKDVLAGFPARFSRKDKAQR